MRSLGLPPPPMPYSSENEPESLIMDETRIMSSLGWIYVLLVAIVFHESMCLATQCGLNCASFYDLGGFRGCLRAAMKAPGALVFPGSPTYTNATQVCNARFAPLPAAIVYAHSTSDVTEGRQVRPCMGCKGQRRVWAPFEPGHLPSGQLPDRRLDQPDQGELHATR